MPTYGKSGATLMCNYAHNMLSDVVPRICKLMASKEHTRETLEEDVLEKGEYDCAIVKVFH